ncbi:Abhydrolase domain-containing protein [Ceratobasidium sp. AG-Ba]|nr:Abhydrolase domain-containing protein [Ceratobasidium sp. AG-Ba]
MDPFNHNIHPFLSDMGAEKSIEEALGPETRNSRESNGIKRRVAIAGLLVMGLGHWYLGHRSHCGKKMATLPETDKIHWLPCGDGYECGRLLVPLDYANESVGHADLSVGRLLAKNTTSRLGSLFVNPGGPGGSGLSFLYRAGPTLAGLLDDRYDIVSWDPRGINGTTPGVDCFASQTAQDIAFAHTYQDIGFEARNLSDPVDLAVYAQQIRKADAENAVIAELCLNRTGEALRHVGTATVVRDLERLSQVIEGPETPVNFWGFSYGTVVERYFVNMFPHRVGNVAIDGVVDPVLWATTGAYEWGKWDLVDTERAYSNFLKACADAGPERCALSTNKTSTATAIRKAVDQLISDLYERPLPVPNAEQSYILTSGMVRNLIFVNMYRPRGWGLLAEQISAALQGNGAPITNAVLNTIELDTTVKAKTALAIEAVTCVDGPDLRDVDPRKAVEAIITENVATYEQVSTHFAAIEASMCHHWNTREAERYLGPFNHTTLANDILVIGNTADPITPVVNARTVNQLLPQSRLIVQDGSGHCSIALASPCTAKAVRGYFLDGVLPPNGIVCDAVEKPFSGAASVGDVGVNAWLDEATSVSDEDVQLAEKMRALGQAMEPFVGLHKKPKRFL